MKFHVSLGECKLTANNCGLPAPTATDYVRKLKSLRPASVLYIYMARYSRNIRTSILQNGCAKTNPHVVFFLAVVLILDPKVVNPV